jgi:hypothetical protein
MLGTTSHLARMAGRDGVGARGLLQQPSPPPERSSLRGLQGGFSGRNGGVEVPDSDPDDPRAPHQEPWQRAS